MSTIKNIYFSIDVHRPSFGPIALYMVENVPGKNIPEDVQYVMSFKFIDELNIMVEDGSFHYYWGHMTAKNREQFIKDMFDFKIEVTRIKK